PFRVVRQIVVSGLGGDELGVATAFGNNDAVEDRRLRRRRVIRMVGMKSLAADGALFAGLLEIAVRQEADLGIFRQTVIRELLGYDVAEQPRRAGELVRREILIAHDQNGVVDEFPVNL